jgi:hypothetical protein
MRKVSRLLYFTVASVAGSLFTADARAAAPGDWSVAVERLFGINRVSVDVEDVDTTTTTSISLLSKVSGDIGYSAPRLAFDYLTGSGLTLGGAIGYQSVSFEDSEADATAWLLAGRVGYFAHLSEGVGIWPRGGLTHVDFDAGDMTALTLEVPFEFFFLHDHGIALSMTPHVDIGIAGNVGPVDRTVTELGLQFGLGVFF